MKRVTATALFSKTVLPTIFTVAVLVTPLLTGVMNASAIERKASQDATQPVDTGKWEVVSIKPCVKDLGFEARGGGSDTSPGRANWYCQTIAGLIYAAHILNPRGVLSARTVQMEGGPPWMDSERYTVNAKAEGTPSRRVMLGPMLQDILADRFKLKLHWETREVQVYALTIARGGPKLQPFKEGSCTPLDFTAPVPPLAEGGKECPATGRTVGPNRKIDAEGITLDMFAQGYLSGSLQRRRVINQTGISGRFNFHLEHAITDLSTDAAAQSDIPIAPSLFTVLEQIGLKLESIRGPGDILIIDHVEKPTEN
jgi:uncharacterized protein (TIGR03435 family)